MALLGIYSMIPIINSMPEDVENVLKVIEPITVKDIVDALPKKPLVIPKPNFGAKPTGTSSAPDFTNINQTIDSILADLASFETNYKDSHTEYYNQKASTSILSYSNLPFSIEIHSYNAPQGRGYQVIFNYISNKIKYYRSEGYGPEAQTRTTEPDWIRI